MLALVGVAPEHIAADYALSAERLPARYAARGQEDQNPLLESSLAGRATTAAEAIVTTLQSVDVAERLRAGGLEDADVAALRARLLR